MILHFLLLASVATVAVIAAAAAACGWVCGYAHRSLIEWGRAHNPVRAVVRAYAELWEDIWYLIETGRFRPGRLGRTKKRPPEKSGGRFRFGL